MVTAYEPEYDQWQDGTGGGTPIKAAVLQAQQDALVGLVQDLGLTEAQLAGLVNALSGTVRGDQPQVLTTAQQVQARVNIGASASMLPQYAPATAAGSYDLTSCSYGLTTSVLSRWHRRRGRPNAGTGNVVIASIGDSSGIGFNGSDATLKIAATPISAAAATICRLLGIPRAGGFIPVNGQGGVGFYDVWVPSATADWNLDQALGNAMSTKAGSALTFTTPYSCTGIDLAYSDVSGPFTYAVDNGSPISVNPGNTPTYKAVKVVGLSPGVHTLQVTAATPTPIYVVGAAPTSTTPGLVAHNFNVGGTTAYGAGLSSWTETSNYGAQGARFGALQQLTDSSVDLWTVVLGGNDAFQGVSIDNFKNAMTTIRNRTELLSSSVILQSAWFVAATSADSVAAYRKARYELADSLRTGLFDFEPRTGDVISAIAAGFVGGDAIHPTWEASTDWGVTEGTRLAG